MTDLIATFLASVIGLVIVAVLAARFPRQQQSWIWLAFLERLVSGVGQLMHARIEGGDQNGYRFYGSLIAHLLDENFAWTAPESLRLLFQQPSALDTLVNGAGTNTGSTCAAASWLVFLTVGSDYAQVVVLAVMSTVSAALIFAVFKKMAPETSPWRVFLATVLFPSLAFWTSGLLKETFCVVGIALMLTGWRGFYENRMIRGVLVSAFALMWTLMFRPPALPPVILGIAVYIIASRKGATKPIYVALGAALVVGGMALVGRFAPEFAVDRISESLTVHQRAWTINNSDTGGSGYDLDEIQETGGQQLARAPIAMVNALLRPQLFDVRNPLMLVSALEMTTLLLLVIRIVRKHGFRGTLARIQASPLLLMCAITTVISFTFVGLATLNFGSLARYRAPFLPFYGMMLAVLVPAPEKVERPQAIRSMRGAARRRIPARVPARTEVGTG